MRLALALSLLVGCAGTRAGIVNDSGGGSHRDDEGCLDDQRLNCAGGRGLDEVALAVTTLAVAGVLIPKLVKKLR